MSGMAALGRLEQVQQHELIIENVSPEPLAADAARNEATAKAALSAAGVPFVEEIVATTADEAAKAAETIGQPVALKILSPDIQHKSDIGGVELGMDGSDAAREAFDRII